jgi:hypothetical protein
MKTRPIERSHGFAVLYFRIRSVSVLRISDPCQYCKSPEGDSNWAPYSDQVQRKGECRLS